jgi:hypothetical protein
MTVRRRGGVLPLGTGRMGVPLDSWPSHEWMDALRQAMAEERQTDDVWQHAARAVSSDEVGGVPHLVFPTGPTDGTDLLVSYVSAIDSAIARANTSIG